MEDRKRQQPAPNSEGGHEIRDSTRLPLPPSGLGTVWPILRCLRGCDPLAIRTRASTRVLISATSVRYLRDT
jgi:hypothetical protein